MISVKPGAPLADLYHLVKVCIYRYINNDQTPKNRGLQINKNAVLKINIPT